MTELDKAAFEQEFDKLWFGNLEEYFNHDAADYANIRNIALHFVNWQYEQFKQKLLEHYDELTSMQPQIESGFIMQHLEKYNKTPTFIDAIKYGRKMAFNKAIEWMKLYILNHDDIDIFEMETAFKNELMEEQL